MGKTIVRRAGWNARPPKRAFSKLRGVVGVVLHHSGVKGAATGPFTVKGFERHHMDSRGWNAIAYNWLVDDDGVIYEGRGGGIVGGATRGWNSRTESICYTGWGSGEVSQRALDSIKWLVSDIQGRYGRGLWVKGHRDLAATSCPGTSLYHWLQDGMPLKADTAPEQDWAGIIAYVAGLGAAVARRPLSRRRRSRGPAVRLVQTKLNGLGHDAGPVDGVYGRLTASAVRSYQQQSGLKADGVVGKSTWTRMFL